ncbi:MAG: hypothetical protein DME20_03135 [Verrucomicrobia bacterium]|nr:MAG: hypothetical protein DME74_04425 [Verrucomicrobiota bacterium]PYJ91464.1 MAG: hypothetical protein DME71_01980 [Verrucomicrobiota bacterium]PYK50985.1 MAG: hypothetical protein DME20_03135 [Verrucomicrobiota bacterium]PYL42117.1 MAG: hypothetical protein DMF42_07980 [Verrucomicrobiota bacterium]
MPNALWRQPQASLESRAKSNGRPQGVGVLSSSQVHLLAELRKGVFPDYQFVGELKSLLLEL